MQDLLYQLSGVRVGALLLAKASDDIDEALVVLGTTLGPPCGLLGLLLLLLLGRLRAHFAGTRKGPMHLTCVGPEQKYTHSRIR